MTDESKKDELDTLNGIVKNQEFYGEAKPNLIAPRYEDAAANLTDIHRKNQALRKAAEYYLRINYDQYFENKRKAIQIYEQIGDLKEAERIREILKECQRSNAHGILKDILSKYQDYTVSLGRLQELQTALAEAGFPEMAKNYEKIVKELKEFALNDTKGLEEIIEKDNRENRR